MKPESQLYLESAREQLSRAPALLEQGFTDEAGRAAYLGGFHAAQALIFERVDRVVKTHRGVHSEFAKLVRDDSRFNGEARAFLGNAYTLKESADYATGPGAKVSQARAVKMIAVARLFLDAIDSAIGS
jgi:uncharacterized protein (UPF0332 family)